jgi:L-iditol 2-dehydrogenase
MKVNGLIITEPHSMTWQEFEVKPAYVDYVRVRMKACGLCTWEQRVYRGAKKTYPWWGGHEVSGIVEEVAPEASSSVRVGDMVSLALMRRCGRCELCRSSLDNHCAYVRPERLDNLPAGPRGLSDHIFVPGYQVFSLNPNIGAQKGTLVEPLACVLRSIQHSQVDFGGSVVVIGGGTFGLLHIAVLRTMAARVIACDEGGQNSSRAMAAGAQVVINSACKVATEQVRELTDGHGVDAVYCIRGGAEWIQAAVTMAARGGRVLLFQSIRAADAVVISANEVHYREIAIIGTISQTLQDFNKAAKMANTNPSLFDSLVIEKVGANEIQSAFERAMDPNVNRVIVSFDT